MMMKEPLIDFYRCPESMVNFTGVSGLSGDPGYFKFGDDLVCFGRCSPGHIAESPSGDLYNSLGDVRFNRSSIQLPFDLSRVIDNLRLERYVPRAADSRSHRIMQSGYYLLRPLLGVGVRRELQKVFLRGRNNLPFPRWPVDTTVEQLFERLLFLTLKSRKISAIPFIWFWPDGARSCAIMTHDVETASGLAFCSELMDIDDEWGLKASFQIVPEERYQISRDLLETIRGRGFEINVQDLNHDGRLFNDHEEFMVRAQAINRYAKAYGASGFRSGSLYRNPDWYRAFDFTYDMSVPNSAHLEAQRGGCCTVFPYFIGKILELPLTTAEDYSLLHILNDYSIGLWKRQVLLIRRRNGLVSFVIHPDYIEGKRARGVYLELLRHLAELRAEGDVWFALPGAVNAWWRERARLQIVEHDGKWVIEGPGSERARLAFAKLEGDDVVYAIAPSEVSAHLS